MIIIPKNRGFTLVEVLVALGIITIILLSFYQLFVQTNKTSVKNNEKLITINLADAALASVQAKTYTKISSSDLNDYLEDESIPRDFILNGRRYTVTYELFQNESKVPNSNYSEKELNLIKVVVTVTSPDGNTNGSSEGYIRYE